MKQHHTKSKGDLGVLKAQVDLYSKGYLILVPLTEHESFDIVAYKDNKFKRIQVKYRSINKHGNLDVQFKSSWADKHGSHMIHVDKQEIDLYCVYCPETDECYYFDPSLFSKSVSLRVKAPKRSTSSNMKFAEDYREVP